VSRRVFLHVGLPKSGTTYLQAVLGKNQLLLKQRANLLYPSGKWSRQVLAVKDVRQMKVPPSQQAVVSGAWDRLVAEMQPWPGDAIMSMEWLCVATDEQIRRIVDDLAPAEVHVVFTVRDVARTVPAAWQEFCQNRSTWRWPEFLEQVTSDDPMSTPAGKALWREQDMSLLLERWSTGVAPERIHVVTLPQSGADPAELWRRLARVLEIDPEGYDLTDLGANASIGMESAELMRRINLWLKDQGRSTLENHRLFKHEVAKRILATRKPQESRVILPASYHDWARSRAAQQIRAIEESGAHVVGDLEELRPRLDDSVDAPATAVEPDKDAVVDAAVHALVTLALQPPPESRTRSRAARARAAASARGTDARGAQARPVRSLLDRVRGRSPKELASAVGRRVRHVSGSTR
jgi:hypothetical protein